MDSTLLLNWLRAKRITIKYTLLTGLVLSAMTGLAALNVFDGVEHQVNLSMQALAEYGPPGMFVIGLFSNTTLVIQVPYNLPMFTLILFAPALPDVLLLGAATGLGAGIGATFSFAVARTLVAHAEDLEHSSLFRWTRQIIERKPGMIPVLVWITSGTPVPDLAIIVPLAMINYPWRKMLLPLVTGKIFQNVVVALIFRYASGSVSGHVSGNINFDLAAIIVILFVMVIFYQVEKYCAEMQALLPVHAPGEAVAAE